MADEKRDPEKPLPEDKDYDPDGYIRTAVTYGRLDLIKDWVPHQWHQPERITELVLFPAAMYGQLEVLDFALDYGNIQQKEEQNPLYIGWNLMHFAVEGIHMNVPNEEENQNGMLSMQEVHSRLLDIVALLVRRGVDVDQPDREGHTPSEKATVITNREECFLDGAILLDMYALRKANEKGNGSVSTPGLETVRKLPSELQWELGIQPLIEWAYSRKQYDVMIFCHNHKLVDLTSQMATISTTERPLMMDAIHHGDYSLIHKIILSQPEKQQARCALGILNKVYEYGLGNLGKWSDSLISYACREYSRGNQNILPALLSPQVIGRQLSHIKIENIVLQEVPAALFHAGLKTLEMKGNGLSTLPIAEANGQQLCKSLEVLNISENSFSALPEDIFCLPSMTRLNASANQIEKVPMEMWTAPALQDLNLSRNCISTLPCPNYMHLDEGYACVPRMSFTHSTALSSPNQLLLLLSTRQAYFQSALHSASDVHQKGFRLETLDLSCNQLSMIPRGLACLAPLLKTLKLNENCIPHLGHPSDYPPMLGTLDVSRNALVQCIQPSSQPPKVVCIQSQLEHKRSSCSHLNHTSLPQLKFLYLGDNQLSNLILEAELVEGEEGERAAGGKGGGQPKLQLLFPKLQSLRLSNNRLKEVPQSLHKHERLCELALDGNTEITRIPSSLHALTDLFILKYEGISDPIVSELKSCQSTPEVLLYLKAREKNYCLNTSLRLFVIGHYHKGKTTLLASLRGKKQSSTFDERAKRPLDLGDLQQLSPEDRESTVGIQCDRWLCKRSDTPKHGPVITFYTWDFAGQEEYYLTHQCFFTTRALYLLVWSVKDDFSGIESLTIWLQNLQAKAPGSSVIVVGTHLDEVPRNEREYKCKVWKERILDYQNQRAHSMLYPNIMEVLFVGIPRKGKALYVDKLVDVIYDVAMTMDVPRDSEVGQNVKVKIMKEMIPLAYEQLQSRVDVLVEEERKNREPPIIPKDQFWARVGDIEGLEEENREAAVDFLHASTGVILHFNLPVLVDYYIIDPQRWFDLCALVISPSNVSKLIRSANRMERGNGQLVTAFMDRELESQGHHKDTGRLIRAFLREHGVIHQIDHDNFLIPSAISPEPALRLEPELGYFPFKEPERVGEGETEEEEGEGKGEKSTGEGVLEDVFSSIVASSSYKKATQKLHIIKTGLVYRRTLHLPPIASGFWSKLISLFIQKEDFLLLISANGSSDHAMQIGRDHLRGMIGNVIVEWHYWKTGIMLIADDQLLMRVNSLRRDVFEDPKQLAVISSAQGKAEKFHYREGKEWRSVAQHFTEVVEVVVPVATLSEEENAPVQYSKNATLSAKVLAKALEIVDEVLKNHSEHLAINGIYTVNDMLQLIPCPICYGDTDHRVQPITERVVGLRSSTFLSLQPRVHCRAQHEPLSQSIVVMEAPKLYTFTVDECIKEASVSDCMRCPKHGGLEIRYLAPDIVFADLAHVKLDQRNLSEPIDLNEQTDLRGSFGKVVKRTLRMETEESIVVAIKIFEQFDSVQPSSATELAKNYADMRYELNKLSTLKHAYIVRFVGVFTNPLCFVLEWAPERSLEHIRQTHAKENQSFCPTSLFLVLLQVTGALSYLHDEVNIIHNDLRCSNILVFKFPPVGHKCLKGVVNSGCAPCLSNSEDCSVVVKVADMGICANPATQKTKNMQGIRQFIPECLNFDAGLTEKADIFSLGSCLYEMMSLCSLPPKTISEVEYRNMLRVGKRATFSQKNAVYPAFLYLLLEECWQQEQFRRPSAALLHSALMVLTGLSLKDGTPVQTTQSLLLDTFQVHQSSRVSAIHSLVVESSFHMLAALSSLDEDHTSIMRLSLYQNEGVSRMEAKPLWEIRNNRVCVLHCTSDGVMLAALANGRVMVFDTNGTRSFNEPEKVCSEFTEEHGEVIAMQYLSQPKLLVMGFDRGKVHIYSCPESIRDTLTSSKRQYCSQLVDSSSLYSIQCLPLSSSLGDTMEVWCGTDSSTVEVWCYKLRPDMEWVNGTVKREESVIPICLPSASRHVTIKQMEVNNNSTYIVALLHQPGSQLSSLAFISVMSKTVVKYIRCGRISVASLSLSPTKLIVGTYEGLVHIFGIQQLLHGSSHALDVKMSEVLRAHHKSVYSVTSLRGDIGMNGYTSFCPTFVGRTEESVSREFLVCIGYGRHSLVDGRIPSVFRSFTQQRGVCLHAWII